jgi:hypothetical protein
MKIICLDYFFVWIENREQRTLAKYFGPILRKIERTLGLALAGEKDAQRSKHSNLGFFEVLIVFQMRNVIENIIGMHREKAQRQNQS